MFKPELGKTSAERAAAIDAMKSARGGWTARTLVRLGVDWPPPKGWRRALINGDNPADPVRLSTIAAE